MRLCLHGRRAGLGEELTAPFGAAPLDEAARLTSAVLAGAALGLNRNLRGKAAGVRTHALVALGAALATVAAAHAVGDPATVTRVMQGVITGIGFIGAGVILHPRAPAIRVSRRASAVDAADDSRAAAAAARRRRGGRPPDVRGLTTAATVWVAAALGLAAGLGLWALTLAGTLLTLGVLAGGGPLETAAKARLHRRRARRRAAARHARRAPSREAAEHDR